MGGKSQSSTLVNSNDWRPVLRRFEMNYEATTWEWRKYYYSNDAQYSFEAISALRWLSGDYLIALFTSSASSIN